VTLKFHVVFCYIVNGRKVSIKTIVIGLNTNKESDRSRRQNCFDYFCTLSFFRINSTFHITIETCVKVIVIHLAHCLSAKL